MQCWNYLKNGFHSLSGSNTFIDSRRGGVDRQDPRCRDLRLPTGIGSLVLNASGRWFPRLAQMRGSRTFGQEKPNILLSSLTFLRSLALVVTPDSFQVANKLD